MCVKCGRMLPEGTKGLCENCTAEGATLCDNCGVRVSNDTTPYCNVCADEIVGAG